jgi:DUF917 family protein
MPWQIKKKDVPILALGSKMLACGGGGHTQTIEHLLLSIMSEHDVIIVKSISEIADEWVVAVGMMGSPVLYGENIPSGEEGIQVLRKYETESKKRANALISLEIGGMNALTPLVTALQAGLPVIDGDGMGRAFPELYMTTFHLNKVSITPLALKTHYAETVLTESPNVLMTTESAKEFTLKNGGYAHIACNGINGRKLITSMIPGTLNLIYRLGSVISKEEMKEEQLKQIMLIFENSVYGRPKLIIEGVISDVNRLFQKELLIGHFNVSGRLSFAGRSAQLNFQNEFLSVREDQDTICTTPDLILVLGAESLMPYSVSEIQEGVQVIVLAIPAPNILRTTDMLQSVGPQHFGLTNKYKPFQNDEGESNNETWH